MRRLVWLAVGVGLGVAVARRLEGSEPAATVEAAAAGVVRRTREVVDHVVADGRAEMRQREARLRSVLAVPSDARSGGRHARGAAHDGR